MQRITRYAPLVAAVGLLVGCKSSTPSIASAPSEVIPLPPIDVELPPGAANESVAAQPVAPKSWYQRMFGKGDVVTDANCEPAPSRRPRTKWDDEWPPHSG